jgi:Holliday junction resolvase
MRACKIDKNQPEIVKALRDAGATVQILSAVGKGCPDILVGINGENKLMEIKFENGKLTEDQVVWHGSWNGSVSIVRSVEDAIQVLRG